MTLTPDIQFYFDPATNPKSDHATVVTLRATLFFLKRRTFIKQKKSLIGSFFNVRIPVPFLPAQTSAFECCQAAGAFCLP